MEIGEFRGYKMRVGTMDSYVIREVSSYRWLPLEKTDIVLDVGANIGSFARHIQDRVAKVVAIEPDPDNFSLLIKNAPKALLINAAVVSGNVVTENVSLYVNSGTNKGLHSTIPTRGREILTVPAVQWDVILDRHQPSKIKIDCEGAEYDFLRPEKLPDCVKGLIIEYNLSRKHEHECGVHTHYQFEKTGWTCTKQPTFTTKAWATLACYERK